MVVFTCNACSAVLKRNQVDKHCNQCRRCESLSCVDCGKDFWGDDYQKHTKCMTEEEKYGAKGTVSKVNKGEAKQEEWVEQVEAAIGRVSNPKLKAVLQRIATPNVPRKKNKFENYMKNSLRIYDTALITQAWDVVMTGNKNQNGKSDSVNNPKDTSESVPTNGHRDNEPEENSLESTVPKSKREKKEERRQKAHKKEKKDKVIETSEDVTADVEVKKVGKKRKRQEAADIECGVVENGKKPKGKKSKANDVNDSKESDSENAVNNDSRLEEADDTHEEEEAPPKKRKKAKFDWEMVIKSVLEKKGEMRLKKLEKKVLSEFAAQDAANWNEENLSSKFLKKVVKIQGVKVSKDRASLKTS